MKRPQVSLSTISGAIAVVAVTCAIVRWGLGLPNLMANDLIQPIVIGSAPMVSLLALGSLLTLRDWSLKGECRPFWIGFLTCGSIALVIYVLHADLLCQPGRHYSVDYELALNALLRRCGLDWDPGNPGGHAVRYVIVIVSLVLLLALPQVLFAVLGGWLAERRRPGRPRVVESRYDEETVSA
jgi:hypothetical protein